MSWKSHTGHPSGKEMWNVPFLPVIWPLWKKRNARCFERMEQNCDFLCERIKFSIPSWVLVNPRFPDLSVDQIMLNWR